MALPSGLPDEVSTALSAVPDRMRRKKEVQAARRAEALTLRMAGLSYEQIGQRLGIKPRTARDLIERTLTRTEALSVDRMREMENARLDRAQAAIWSDVLNGDQKAIDTFLRISSARRQLNGLNAPQQVNISLGIRNEMEMALLELEALVNTPKVLEMEALSVEDEQKARSQFSNFGLDDEKLAIEGRSEAT